MRRVPDRKGLYEVSPGRYKLVVYAGKDERGRQRQRTRTFEASGDRAAKKAAHGIAALLEAEISEQAARNHTIAGAVEAWRDFRAAEDSPSTIRGQRSQVKRIIGDLGAIRVEALTARQLDAWYADLRAAGMTASTIRAHYRILHAAIHQWWDWAQCSRSPIDALKRSKPPTSRPRQPAPPTPQALAVLLDLARPDLRVAALLAATTGMRRGEIIGLRWSDIAGNRLTVHRSAVELGGGRQMVKAPKTDKPRVFTLGAGVLAALAAHRADLAERAAALGGVLAADGPVLADVSVDPTGATARRLGWLTLAWSRHAERCGAPDVRFHDLRHWHATQLTRGGVDVKVTQARLGHSTAKTTLDIYAHAVEEADAAAADMIDRLLELSPAPSTVGFGQ